MSTGRKKDPIWVYFDKLAKDPGKVCEKVQCKKCKLPVQQLVARMKAHIGVCDQSLSIEPDSDPDAEYVETQPVPSTSIAIRAKANTSVTKHSSRPIDAFLVKTSSKAKAEIDIQWARVIYATNASFRSIDHPEVQKLCEMMRPGYKPPSRALVGDHY